MGGVPFECTTWKSYEKKYHFFSLNNTLFNFDVRLELIIYINLRKIEYFGISKKKNYD